MDMMSMDSRKSDLRCAECGKSFKRGAILRDHLRGHRNEKPFQCGTCHKSFARSNDMKRHEGTHLEKQFGCDLCGKKFTRQLSLTKHAKIHQQEIDALESDINARELASRLPSSSSSSREVWDPSLRPASPPPEFDPDQSPSKRIKLTRSPTPRNLVSAMAIIQLLKDSNAESTISRRGMNLSSQQPELSTAPSSVLESAIEEDAHHSPLSSSSASLSQPGNSRADQSTEASPADIVDLTRSPSPNHHACDRTIDNDDAISIGSHPVSDLALVLAQNTLDESSEPRSPDWSSFVTPSTPPPHESNGIDDASFSDIVPSDIDLDALWPYAFPCLQHTFSTMDQLRRHMLEEHRSNLSLLASSSFFGSSKLGFVCYLHGGHSRAELVEHCELEHKIPGDETNYLAQPSDTLQMRVAREEHRFLDTIGEDYLSDSDDEEDERYFCDVCPAEYESRAPFARHLVSHLENVYEQPYKCRRCDLTFSSEEIYSEHRSSPPHIVVKSKYWTPELFCPFKCGEVFPNALARNEHARATSESVCKGRAEQEDVAWNTSVKQLSQLSAGLELQLGSERTSDPSVSRDLVIKMIWANISRWKD